MEMDTMGLFVTISNKFKGIFLQQTINLGGINAFYPYMLSWTQGL